MEEGQVSRWLKKEGDKVSMGEPLAEIDTDKATMEMQALANGVLRKILINEGESAPLGQLIAIIGEPDEDISSLLSQSAGPPAKSQAPTAAKVEPEKPAPEKPAPQASVAQGNGSHAAEVREKDTSGRLIVSPLAARMAAEAGIDLRSLQGSGPGGRIIKKDIEAAISKPSGAPATQTALGFPRAVASKTFQPAATAAASPYRDELASEIRRTIAKRLATSLGPIPHFFLTSEIEMDRAVEMRSGINSLDPELKLSINDIIIKVAAAALIQHPQVNASFQEKLIRYYERADIGVAVAIEDGLITPVVRSADQKSLSQIANEVRDNVMRPQGYRWGDRSEVLTDVQEDS
jgi:pyruvate dehydrogenase E2 component (dihydrolipoamide acetyltransferase)